MTPGARTTQRNATCAGGDAKVAAQSPPACACAGAIPAPAANRPSSGSAARASTAASSHSMPRSAEMIENLIRRAVTTFGKREQLAHVRGIEIGDAPAQDLARRAAAARRRPPFRRGERGRANAADRDRADPCRAARGCARRQRSRFFGRRCADTPCLLQTHGRAGRPSRAPRFLRRRRRRTSRRCRRASSRDRIRAQAPRFPPRRAPCARPWSTFPGRAPARSCHPETTRAATPRSSASPCRGGYRNHPHARLHPQTWIMAPSDPTANACPSTPSRREPSCAAPVRTIVRTPAPCSSRWKDGRAIEVRGAPDHPPTAGTLCTKVARYLERTYSRRARALPDATRRQEGRGPLRAHLLGRSARHHRGEIRRDRRLDRRPAGHRAVLVRRDDGPSAIRLDGSPLLPSPRRVAPRPDHLRDRGQGRLGRDDRRRHRNRRRAIREQPPDSHLGQQPGHLQPAPVDARAGSEAPRRASSSPSTPIAARPRRSVTSMSRSFREPTPRSRSA